MQFVIIAIHVALVVLTAWWTNHGWAKASTLSQRLDTAGGKFGIALVAAYFIPLLLLSGFGPFSQEAYDSLTLGGLTFACVALIFFVAARGVKTRENFLSREAQRLSGYLVPPKLWPAWGVATVTGFFMFILIFAVNLAFMFLSTYIVSLQNMYITSNSMSQAVAQNFAVGTAIVWIFIVVLMWAIQKVTIYTAERDYTQLSAGIENRLAQQRVELLATMDTESSHEKQ